MIFKITCPNLIFGLILALVVLSNLEYNELNGVYKIIPLIGIKSWKF